MRRARTVPSGIVARPACSTIEVSTTTECPSLRGSDIPRASLRITHHGLVSWVCPAEAQRGLRAWICLMADGRGSLGRRAWSKDGAAQGTVTGLSFNQACLCRSAVRYHGPGTAWCRHPYAVRGAKRTGPNGGRGGDTVPKD
jgi:hypothetical protein